MSENHDIDRIRRVGRRLCLDFVNSVHQRPARGPADDYLHSLADCLQWCEKAGLIDAGQCRHLARQAKRPDERLAEFKALRELLHRIFDRVSQGKSPGQADIQQFAEYARAAHARQHLAFSEGRAHWHSPAPDKADLRLADPIVLDADALLTGDRLERIKRCEPDAGCGWLFLDTSKNRSRRWCSMETCGSAHKARAWYHRQRRKHQPGERD